MIFKTETVPAKRLRELLDYDPLTGVLRWKKRPERTRWDKMLNAKYAGKIAGWMKEDGYMVIGIDGEIYKAHRVIWAWMTGEWPSDEIDHKNYTKTDNRWCNLRQVTHSQNGSHRGMPNRRNTSGYRGITYRKDSQCWRAYLKHQGKFISIGSFDDIDDARRAYWQTALSLRGEYAGA